MIDLTPAIYTVVHVATVAIIASGVLQNAIYFFQLAIAASVLVESRPEPRSNLLWHRYAEVCPAIALLVPAFDEENNIVASVRSLLSLQYPDFQVLAINDGSTDDTLLRLIASFNLHPAIKPPYEALVPHNAIRGIYKSADHPNLIVIDKARGGKSDALNAGINLSTAPLICAMDADSLLEPDALLRVVQPFIDQPERTVAAGGTIRLMNGCRIESGRVQVALPRTFLGLVQTVEYLRAFLMARIAWSRMRSLIIISGAFGVFKRTALVSVGGYSHETVGEDFEVIVKIHRYMLDRHIDYLVSFIPEPVCWTEAPENLRDLGRQRSRWHRGALETFFKHRDMLFRPQYGRIGTLGFGQCLITDVVGPLLEVLGYCIVPMAWLLGVLSIDYLLAFLALTFVFGICVSVCSLVFAELQLRRFPRANDIFVLTFIAVIENLGYRQLNNIWRLRGLFQFMRGKKGWGG